MRCRCGGNQVETDASSGTTFCVACGEVLEENSIVAEVTFQEVAGGKTILQGTFAGESGRISTSGPFGRGRGKEGQEQAMENGRQKIARLAYALHLPERYREAAQRYYNLAVINRFTRGRKSEHVAAVCLYIVCRNEQSSQMLIDFSDLLQANVFVLGATFLKLVRVLCLKLPLVDPSIYISRFAAALDFGEYTQRVAHDAVRLVQRMDRDWIRTGRRPAGICGACLLIAARMNGFRRTTREVIYVAKVAEITINTRLKEFRSTESAELSVQDFRTMWLEKEADPPAFAKARKADAKENTPDVENPVENTTNEPQQATLVENETQATSVKPQPEWEEIDELAPSPVPDTQATLVNPQLEKEMESMEKEMEEWMQDSSVKEATEALERENAEKAAKEIEEVSLSDVDDDEIDAMLLNPEEVKMKTTVWYNANKDYLEEMKAKARKIAMDKAMGVYQKKGGNRNRRKQNQPQAASPAEAAKQLVQSKKLSKKINQAVFDDMFETAESIERLKQQDRKKREREDDYSEYEVVEESGESEKKSRRTDGGDEVEREAEEMYDDDDDDEDMDPEDMADDERIMMEGRRAMGWIDADEDEGWEEYD